MLIRHGENEFQACPALAVMAVQLVAFCDKYKLPLSIYRSNEEMFEIITKDWSDVATHKFHYHLNKDYSDLAKPSMPICVILENSIIITVSKYINIDKFNKD